MAVKKINLLWEARYKELIQHLLISCHSEEEMLNCFNTDVLPKIDKIIAAIREGKTCSLSTRQAKAKAIVILLRQEFETTGVLNLINPSDTVAGITKRATEAGLISSLAPRKDKVFAVYRHLHAYAEGLKPYGTKSRRAGEYREWLKKQYGEHANELIRKADLSLKKLLLKS